MPPAVRVIPSRSVPPGGAGVGVGVAASGLGGQELTPRDLGELLTTFNEVTGRLQGAHEALTAEVSRLQDELKGANRSLRRAKQLAALGEMAAGIAHEVRNPLGSIKLYAKVLVDDLADRPGEREVARKIAGAVDRLNAVVGDVLQFSREIEPRRARGNVWEIVEPSIDAGRDIAGRAEIELRFDRGALEACEVTGDAALLTQALANVVRNACEAIEESGGAGGLGERVVEVSAERRGVLDEHGARRPSTVVVVRDTGPGVPNEALARAFNPFFTTRHTGTGLGLAIVHRIMDAHGGGVSIRNNGGGGTAEGAAGGRRHVNQRRATARDARGATVELVIPDPNENAEESAE